MLKDLVTQARTSELRSAVARMPIQEALPEIRRTALQLPSSTLTKLQQEGSATRDRLAGILAVAIKLEMPQFNAFGAAELTQGDTMSDYDHARAFIVRQLPEKDAYGPPAAGLFYPEVLGMAPADRVLSLARSHIMCTPTGDRQVNLFSLNARCDYKTARQSTQPGGTTCALFLRAILVAAGDKRMTDDKLGAKPTAPPHMIRSMGLNYDNYMISGKGWVSTTKKDLAGKSLSLFPKAGDLFFISLTPFGKVTDSGHVGIIEEAHRIAFGLREMRWITIDGGQKAGHPKGWWTIRNDRTFKKRPEADYPWRLDGWQYTINGKQRDLIGWVAIREAFIA